MSGTSRDPYLQFTAAELESLSDRGLGKLLFVRRESIYLKNVLRKVLQQRERFGRVLHEMGLTWPDYLELFGHRMGRMLKVRREFASLEDPDLLVKFQGHGAFEFVERLRIPAVYALDFDRTLTNRKLLAAVKHRHRTLQKETQLWVVSAHGRREVIEAFLEKHALSIRRDRVVSTGGVAGKRRALFDLALQSRRPLLLHFDDEIEMCELAVCFGYHSYQVRKGEGFLRRVRLRAVKE